MDRFHSILYAFQPSPVGRAVLETCLATVSTSPGGGWLAGWLVGNANMGGYHGTGAGASFDSESAPSGASLGRLPFRNGNYVPSTGDDNTFLGFSAITTLAQPFRSRDDLTSTSRSAVL